MPPYEIATCTQLSARFVLLSIGAIPHLAALGLPTTRYDYLVVCYTYTLNNVLIFRSNHTESVVSYFTYGDSVKPKLSVALVKLDDNRLSFCLHPHRIKSAVSTSIAHNV